MPNPLSLIPTAHAAASKPEAEQRDAEKSIRFQDVLENERSTTEPEVQMEEEPEVELDLPEDEDVAGDVLVEHASVPAERPELSENRVADPSSEPVEQEGKVPADRDPLSTESNPAVQSTDVASKELQDPALALEVAKTETPQRAYTRSMAETIQQKPVNRVDLTPTQPTQASSQLSSSEPARPAQDAPLPDSPVPPQTAARPQVPDRIPTLAQIQVMVSAQVHETESTGLTSDVDSVLPSNLLHTTRASAFAAPVSTQSARAGIARAMAGQMAAAIQVRSGSGAVEIALSPEELGRVSIVLNGREDGLYMSIAAERPETLDLMRRHLSVLASEFQKLGYGDISFDLGTSADTHHEANHQKAASLGDTELDKEDTLIRPAGPRIGPARSIDIRL